jgi:small subunit ribosomal protein S9
MKKAGIHAIGRRKTAVARVYLRPGAGKISVNGKDYQEFFGRKTLQMITRQPIEAIPAASGFDIFVNVSGGGSSGQAGAVRHAISRALVSVDEGNRKELRTRGYLTRDARMVERKKYGRHGARRRPQFSKR